MTIVSSRLLLSMVIEERTVIIGSASERALMSASTRRSKYVVNSAKWTDEAQDELCENNKVYLPITE